MKQNGKGEMMTLGISAVEGIERAREMLEANMRGAWEVPRNHKNMVTVTMTIYVTSGNWPTLIVRFFLNSVFYVIYILIYT